MNSRMQSLLFFCIRKNSASAHKAFGRICTHSKEITSLASPCSELFIICVFIILIWTIKLHYSATLFSKLYVRLRWAQTVYVKIFVFHSLICLTTLKFCGMTFLIKPVAIKMKLLILIGFIITWVIDIKSNY